MMRRNSRSEQLLIEGLQCVDFELTAEASPHHQPSCLWSRACATILISLPQYVARTPEHSQTNRLLRDGLNSLISFSFFFRASLILRAERGNGFPPGPVRVGSVASSVDSAVRMLFATNATRKTTKSSQGTLKRAMSRI